jgi:predicted nucleic acid-binding Zn finger protein
VGEYNFVSPQDVLGKVVLRGKMCQRLTAISG